MESLVRVRINGVPHYTYPFNANETVLQLKITVEHIFSIPRDEQLLLFGDTPLMRDHKTLSQYGIIDGSFIDLHKKQQFPIFEVTIISEEGVHMVTIPNMASHDAVMHIKHSIEQTIGYHFGRQSLHIQTEELCNSDLLRDFSVMSQPTVTLASRAYDPGSMFIVRVVESTTRCLIGEVLVEPLDRVRLLEWFLGRLNKTRWRPLQLFLGTRKLAGDEMMASLCVSHNSEFHVIFLDHRS